MSKMLSSQQTVDLSPVFFTTISRHTAGAARATPSSRCPREENSTLHLHLYLFINNKLRRGRRELWQAGAQH